jgi:hypothetical protein
VSFIERYERGESYVALLAEADDLRYRERDLHRDYTAAANERTRLAEQLRGAVEALEEIFDDLKDVPMSSYWPGAHHARQVAEMALERLRGGQ